MYNSVSPDKQELETAMKMGFAGFFKHVLCLVMLILVSNICVAQHGEPLNVSECFPQMLIDKRVDVSSTKLRWAFLSVWNRELFEAAKQRAVMKTLTGYGYSDNDFEKSDEQRINDFHENKESLAYDNDTASARFFLDDQAGGIIRDCLREKSRHSYGLSYTYFVDNAWDATLELFWIWAPADVDLLVRTKSLRNAKVTDDHGSHPEYLLPRRHFGLSEWGTATQETTLIPLERLDANEDIIINIETFPNVGAQHIVIPSVHPKENCTRVTSDKDKFGTRYEGSYPTLTDALPVIADDGKGHKYFDHAIDISKAPNGQDGIISSVTCGKIASPQDYMEITSWKSEGTIAHCYGWWQERGRNIQMDVKWYKTGYNCTSIPWPTTRPH
jgi:hypothetical protein